MDHLFLVTFGCILPGELHRSAFVMDARSVAREYNSTFVNHIFEILDLSGIHGSTSPQVLLFPAVILFNVGSVELRSTKYST